MINQWNTIDGNPPMSFADGSTNMIPQQQMSMAPSYVQQQMQGNPQMSMIPQYDTSSVDKEYQRQNLSSGLVNPQMSSDAIENSLEYKKAITDARIKTAAMKIYQNAFKTSEQKNMDAHPFLTAISDAMMAYGQGLNHQPYYTNEMNNRAALQKQSMEMMNDQVKPNIYGSSVPIVQMGADGKPVVVGTMPRGSKVLPQQSSIAGVDMTRLPQDKAQLLQSLPPDIATNVQGAADYKLDPNKLYGVRSNAGERAKFDALVQKVNPSFDMKEYPRRQAFLTKWDSSPMYAQTQQSLDLVMNHVGALGESMSKMDNGSLMIANAGKNEVQRQVGQAAIATAMVDAQAVSTEFTKALRGAGVINEKDQERWDKRITTSGSPDQIKGVNAELVNLLSPRMNFQINKYKSTMGELPKGTFTPEAIAVLQKLGTKKLPQALQEFVNQEQGQSVGQAGSTPFQVGGDYNGHKILSVQQVK